MRDETKIENFQYLSAGGVQNIPLGAQDWKRWGYDSSDLYLLIQVPRVYILIMYTYLMV